MMKPLDIITIGSATRDVFLSSRAIRIVPDDQFSTGEAECFALGSKVEIDNIVFDTGGGATNTAVGFARQGIQVAFIGRIGAKDARGREIVAELEAEKVNTSLVVRDRTAVTAYSVILLTSRGERTVLIYRGASARFRKPDFPWTKIRSKWLYVTSMAGQLEMVRSIWRHAHQRGMKIAWNPGSGELHHGLSTLAPLIAQTDILMLNQEESTSLFGLNRFQDREAFHQLRPMVRGAVVVTSGTDGSYGGDRTHAWHCGTHHIRVVDTTGAGDAYGCAFTGAILRGKSIPQALQFGNANSESVIQSVGAKPGLLRRAPSSQLAAITRL